MKKKKNELSKEMLSITLAPPLLIIVLTLFPFLLNVGGMGFIASLLLLFFPVLFIIQGVYSRIRKINPFLPILTSLAAFLLMLVIFLNSSALVYVPAYAVLGFIGYYLAKVLEK